MSAAGICDRCRHQRVVPNTRGSRFSLCRRSETDAAYPKYPRLPVAFCDGFEPTVAAACSAAAEIDAEPEGRG